MPLNKYGTNATLDDVLRERSRDMSTVETLEKGKLTGRDMTGVRATPSAWNDIIQGDALGDVVNTATHCYVLRKIGGVLKWAESTHDTAF